MSHVYDGEEWKYAPEPKAAPTRFEEQCRINTLFALGLITLDEYRRLGDELSEPTRWTAAGRILV